MRGSIENFVEFDGSPESIDQLTELLKGSIYPTFWMRVETDDHAEGHLRIKIPKPDTSGDYHIYVGSVITLVDGHLDVAPNRYVFDKWYRVRDGLSHITVTIERDGEVTEIKFNALNGITIEDESHHPQYIENMAPFHNIETYERYPVVKITDLVQRPDGSYYTYSKRTE